MMIRSDNRVKIYADLKKSVSYFVMYSLCLTSIDMSIEKVMFNGDIGAVVCVEGMKSDALALSVVDSKNEYSLYVLKLKV